MESRRPRLPSNAIKHILIHEAVLKRFAERAQMVLGNFPDISPIVTRDFDSGTIQRHFKTIFPDATILDDRKTPSSIGAGKKLLVIGTIQKQDGVVKAVDPKGLVCHCYYDVMVMNNGCIYDCQYCFLQRDVHRGQAVTPYIQLSLNYEEIVERMAELARERLKHGMATRFLAGVHMDYLGMESITRFIEFMVPRLGDEAFARTTVEMWSKGNDTRVLCDAARRYPWARERLLPGWSVNTRYASEKIELSTASMVQRLKAARELQEAGFSQTIRIDPLIPHQGWKEGYEELVDLIFGEYALNPSSIIVGSLRFDGTDLIENARARFSKSELFKLDFTIEDGAKYRLAPRQRLELFETVIRRIRHHKKDQVVGVCKERMDIWNRLGLDPMQSCLSGPVLKTTDPD